MKREMQERWVRGKKRLSKGEMHERRAAEKEGSGKEICWTEKGAMAK